MSERASDPQPYEQNKWPNDWEPRATLSGEEITALFADAKPILLSLGNHQRGFAWPRGSRPPLWTFAWACLYVAATTRVGRAITSLLVVALTLAFCLALLVAYFWMAGWAR